MPRRDGTSSPGRQQEAREPRNRGSLGRRIYDVDYFSGSQGAIYIGDVLVDEVTHIGWVKQQSKVPIYGYASQLFDAVVPGVVIVEGQMTINFKEAGYLWLVLSRYKALQSMIGSAVARATRTGGLAGSPEFWQEATRRDPGQGLGFSPFPGSESSEQNLIQRQSIESLLDGTANIAQRFDFFQQIAGYVSAGEKTDSVAEALLSDFENRIWQNDARSDLDKTARSATSNVFDDVDIFVTFGDWNSPRAHKTVKRLTGVRFTSEGQEMMITGEPLQEQYTFLARNVV